ncbi:fucolectin-related protein [Plakobranchus ocellatus]|uniref:Fucolectin-related protein n=1 Tax=Plakobranchus ocellatus TaxID=259542 RepID=A0AAV3ZSK5_9GAST|nr:fucolectin-related protein [Plakobranchus ocellatus]
MPSPINMWNAILAILVIFCWRTQSASICYTTPEEKSDCKYHCHCRNVEVCNNFTGSCPSKCARGWFGPGCQYVSLPFVATMGSAYLAWLTDENDDVCNEGAIEPVSVVLWTPQILSWFRIVVNNKQVDLGDFRLVYKTDNREEHECAPQAVSRVDHTTLDISCPTSGRVEVVTLSGPGVKSLCSLYISGGRNVALKQETKQSSTYQQDNVPFSSSKAVDGRVYSTSNNVSSTCSHTKEWEGRGQWNLTFWRPVELYKLRLNNRWKREKYCCIDRLKGFEIHTFDQRGKSVFNYTDQSTKGLPDYVITLSEKAEENVKQIQITKVNGSNILTLCEVFAYGDHIQEVSCDENTKKMIPTIISAIGGITVAVLVVSIIILLRRNQDLKKTLRALEKSEKEIHVKRKNDNAHEPVLPPGVMFRPSDPVPVRIAHELVTSGVRKPVGACPTNAEKGVEISKACIDLDKMASNNATSGHDAKRYISTASTDSDDGYTSPIEAHNLDGPYSNTCTLNAPSFLGASVHGSDNVDDEKAIATNTSDGCDDDGYMLIASVPPDVSFCSNNCVDVNEPVISDNAGGHRKQTDDIYANSWAEQ